MDAIIAGLVRQLEAYLRRVCFEDIEIEHTPMPEYVIQLLADPERAKSWYYFKVTTSIGTFGVIPLKSGLAIDLTGTGLAWTDFAETNEGEDPDKFKMVLMPNLGNLMVLRLKLAEKAGK